jgi:deoxyribonuclease-4
LRIGIHTSIAISLEDAVLTAHGLGANTVQIFSASPRMWRGSVPDSGDIARLNLARRRLDLTPLVVHANYLVNLAAADPVVRERSIAAFREELARSRSIGADYVVLHAGSSRDQSVDSAIATFADSLARAAHGIRSRRLGILIENTAGAGSALGSRFEELHEMRRLARPRVGVPIGFCLDTAHCLAAGYDIASGEGLERTLSEADRLLGLAHVRVVHANDSKAPLGSRRDRHQHIGKGYIGREAFRRILTHPRLRDKAFILETPVDSEGDDRRNIQALKRLCRKSPTITPPSR